jgi:hypothetical protein
MNCSAVIGFDISIGSYHAKTHSSIFSFVSVTVGDHHFS